VPGVTLLDGRDVASSSAYLYSMLVENRDGFIRCLTAAGIGASPVHMRNDVHTCVVDHREPLPGVDRADAEMVSIPVGWWVSEEDRERVVSRIIEGW
jgi:dTDP-4-amino-4,6-dideoxygalactose transaminase